MKTSTSSYSQSASATFLTSAVNSDGLSNTTALTRSSTSATLTRVSTSATLTASYSNGTSWVTSSMITYSHVQAYHDYYGGYRSANASWSNYKAFSIYITPGIFISSSTYGNATSLVYGGSSVKIEARNRFDGGSSNEIVTVENGYSGWTWSWSGLSKGGCTVYVCSGTQRSRLTITGSSVSGYGTRSSISGYGTRSSISGYSGISSSSSSESASGTCWE